MASEIEVQAPGSVVSPRPSADFSRRLKQLSQEQIVLVTTMVLAAAFTILVPGFASIKNMLTLLDGIAVLGILSLGAAIVIIGRGLDISQVASLAIGAALAAVVMRDGGTIAFGIVCGFAVALGIGVINGLVIAFIEVPPLFATLATNLLMYGLAQNFIIGSTYLVYVPEHAKAFLVLGGNVSGVPLPVLIFLALALIVHLFLSRTRLGRFIYAHGDNPEAARLSGLPLRPLTILEYSLCAVIGYLAGLVLMATLSSIDTQIVMGTEIFNVILVAVLGGVSLVGGRGGVLSVIAGCLLIGVMLNGMTLLNMSDDAQNIFRGLVLLAAIVCDNRLHPRDEETARQGD
ncbi:MAG TPA: ABC transporter permease [Acetobacteraceae bacterium]|nr:ABC transporter permease [Acetobacteraceae bacterium]